MGAAGEVVDAAVAHLGVATDLCHALAVELEPGEAAAEVGGVGVGGELLLEGVEGGDEVGGGGVAECGGVVEGEPAGGLGGRGVVDDDGRGGGVRSGAAVAVADDVEDEDADDEEEEDVVAGAKAHEGF